MRWWRSGALLTLALLLGCAAGEGAQSSAAPAPPASGQAQPAGAKPGEQEAGEAPASNSRRKGRAKRTDPKVALGSGDASADSRGSRREVTLTANLLGGYDDNAGAMLGSGAGAVPVAPTSGSTGLADVMVEYFRGSPQKSILVRSLANLTIYPDYLDGPAPGGKARVVGVAPLGAKTSVKASAQVRYEPLFTTGVGEPDGVLDLAQPSGGTPPPAAPNVPNVRLFERRSWVSSNKAYLTRDWNRRDTTVVSYLFFAQRFDDGSGDNSYHEAAASYSRGLSRAATVGASYRYLNGRYGDYAGVSRPTIEHTVAAGPAFSKSLRRQRQLSVALNAGASYVEGQDTVTNQPYANWAPYASAAAMVDISTTWQLGASYARRFSTLQGLTGQVYSTDAAGVSASGRLSRRSDVTVGGTFANGRSLVTSGMADTFNLYGVTAQYRYALTTTLAASAGYFYYTQRYSEPAALPTGFPAQYDRNALVVGLSFSTSGRLRAPGDW